MFTGIVRQQLKIQQRVATANTIQLWIDKPHWAVQRGDSILLNGICTTITSLKKNQLAVELVQETLQHTTAVQFQAGNSLHAEPPLTLQAGLSGWIVTGHVDMVLAVAAYHQSGQHTQLRFTYAAVKKPYRAYIMPEGSITIDGVNLTIRQFSKTQWGVDLIPETLQVTHLGKLKAGSKVNVEFDYLAKVIHHLGSAGWSGKKK